MKSKAFTLIELLVVVAIIAILAAIAVPNLLHAQTRAKVSRAKADLRTLAVGLDMYFVDCNRYPYCNNNITSGRRPDRDGTIPSDEKPVLEALSTPISYLTNSFIADPFRPKIRTQDHDAAHPQGALTERIEDTNVGIRAGYNVHWLMKYGSIDPKPSGEGGFANRPTEMPRGWIIYSGGPDGNYPAMGTIMKASQPTNVPCDQVYDATNGTLSYGDIYRVGADRVGGDGFAGVFMQIACRQR
ncbi:hypothetical protein BH09SUM1_BH09SUM1_26450 [soil metagenome]